MRQLLLKKYMLAAEITVRLFVIIISLIKLLQLILCLLLVFSGGDGNIYSAITQTFCVTRLPVTAS